jgi:hypothetical protein
LEKGETRFLVAPHGTGKTVGAKAEHDRAEWSLAVTTTQALTVANAKALGLTSVYERHDAHKASTTLAQLHRYRALHGDPSTLDFVHVDEADSVLAFVYSGLLRARSLESFRQLLDYVSHAKRALLASADLTPELVALFVGWIRARNPGRKITLYVRPPGRSRTLRLVHARTARAELHEAVTSGERVYCGATVRVLPGDLARSYPEASPLWVSGENSRHVDTLERLNDPGSLLGEHRLVVASPALVSGVSLTGAVDRVLVLHEHRGVRAASVLQLAMRARNGPDIVTVGVPSWSRQFRRYDLGKVLELRSKVFGVVTGRAALADREFVQGWELVRAAELADWSDPVGALEREAARLGMRVEHDRGPPDARALAAANALRTQARTQRKAEHAAAVHTAEPLTSEQLQVLERSPALRDGEQERITATRIRDFFGWMDADLAAKDLRGRVRRQVQAYVLARRPDLAEMQDLDQVERQVTELSNHAARATLLRSLVQAVGGDIGEPFRIDSSKALRWWEQHAAKWRTFDLKSRGPHPEQPMRWVTGILRSLGAEIRSRGRTRTYSVDWGKVERLSKKYVSVLDGTS